MASSLAGSGSRHPAAGRRCKGSPLEATIMKKIPFNLERFVSAQAEVFAQVLEELRAGAKRTHWIWFIFPQMKAPGPQPAGHVLRHRFSGGRLWRICGIRCSGPTWGDVRGW